MLKTKVLVIITVGISVGFLLGMGVSALLRAMIAGGDRGLEMTFTALVVFMAGILITYGLKFSPAAGATEEAETTPALATSEGTVPERLQAQLENPLSRKYGPVLRTQSVRRPSSRIRTA